MIENKQRPPVFLFPAPSGIRGVFAGMVLAFFVSLTTCVSLKKKAVRIDAGASDEKEESSLAPASDGVAVLAPLPSEAGGELPLGLTWVPWLLPLVPDVVVRESDFFAGVIQRDGFHRAPPEGECLVFPSSRPASLPADAKAPVRKPALTTLIARAEPPALAHGGVFFLLDAATGLPTAVGIFDGEGRARCAFDPSRTFVSTGFGDQRLETRPPAWQPGALPSQPELAVAYAARGSLLVRGEAGTGVRPGDVLRLGRVSPRLALGGAPTVSFALAEKLERDLFTGVISASENFGIDEFLGPTLLVSQAPYALTLEPGSYVAALVRSVTAEPCVARVQVEAGKSTVLTCVGEERGGPFGSAGAGALREDDSLVFDATFLPLRLLRSAGLRRWMSERGLSHFLADSLAAGGDGGGAPDQGPRTFLLHPVARGPAPLGPFSGLFPTHGGLFARPPGAATAQATRTIAAGRRAAQERFLADFYAGSDSSVAPLGGVSETASWLGAVPFSVETRLTRGLDPAGNILVEKNEWLATNGAIIEWLEPVPASSRLPLPMPAQQRFRARVHIPAHNGTEFAELFINGKVHRRFVIPRGPLGRPHAFTIDERIDATSDFEIGICAWGNVSLSEFLIGSTFAAPVAMTGQVCVDVNKNGRCEARR